MKKALALATVLTAALLIPSAKASFFFEDFEGLTVGGSWSGSWTGDYAAINDPGTFLTGTGTWNVGGNPGSSGIDLVKGVYLHSGLYGIDLAGSPGPGSIYRNLSFVAGQQYQLTFLAAASSSVYDDIQFVIGSQTITWNNAIAVSPSFSTYTLNFTSDGGSLFKMASLAGGNGNLFIDNIRIQAVPEPFTMVLGAAGIGLALRRRAKKA